MTARVVGSIAELRALVGTELGVGQWYTITQPVIDAYAEISDDHQWIHVDPARAAESPFGATIAHGLLLLSLLPRLQKDRDGVRVELPRKMAVNYGLDRVRWISPVRAGSRVRLRTSLKGVDEVRPGVHQIRYLQTLELEGGERPAMVAETIQWTYL